LSGAKREMVEDWKKPESFTFFNALCLGVEKGDFLSEKRKDSEESWGAGVPRTCSRKESVQRD